MSANQPVAMSVPLDQLRVDEKANVRKIGRGADPVLMTSIAAIGLRTPLSVRKNGTGYVVIDGGQRLLALQALVKSGDVAADYAVPCMISKEVDVEAVEVSLQLNVTRQEMHEVDEYRAYADLAKRGIPAATIAKRFSKTERQVEQRLALGQLDEKVLAAYVDDKIGADAIRAFTQAPSKVAQVAALEKVLKGGHVNGWAVRKALGMTDNDAGKYLELVGEEAYVKRGGKVSRDLFGSDHIVSDPGLIKAMVAELLEAECKNLVADGWKEATTTMPQNQWSYERIADGKTTQKEAKRLKEIEALMESETITEEEQDALELEAVAINQAVADRTITPEIKAKAICFVSVHHTGKKIEVMPRYYPKQEPAAKKAAEKKKAEKAALPPADTVSQALMSRMGETLTEAAAAIAPLTSERGAILAGLIAALTSRDSSTIAVRFDSNRYDDKAPKFASALKSAMKLSHADQVDTIVKLVADAINLRSHNGAPLDQENNRAFAEALDGGRLTKAIREKFAAQDYFDSVSKPVIADAVAEAMGKDHAVNVARMDKGGAAKFAAANLPKTKWLPKQLRTSGYDGPKGRPVQVITPKAKKKARR